MKYRAAIIGKEGITMKKDANKMSLKEAFCYTIKGVKIWWGYDPGIIVSTLCSAAAGALFPYVNIYLSAKILSELSGNRERAVLMQLALFTILTNAALALLKAAADRWKECKRAGEWMKTHDIYADKMLRMDFSVLDDTDTHKKLSQIQQLQNWSGKGLLVVLGYVQEFVGEIVKILGAVTLTVTLFLCEVPASAGNLTILNHPLTMIVVIGSFLIAAVFGPVFETKVGEKQAQCSGEATLVNRIFNFWAFYFLDKKNAMDIRLYGQEKTGIKAMESDDSFFPGGLFASVTRGKYGLLYAVGKSLTYFLMGGIYLFVVVKAWAGAFGIGELSQYVGALTMMAGAVSALFTTIGSIRVNAVFVKKTIDFLDIPNRMYKGSLTVEKRTDGKYEVEFRDVSFKYPGSEAWALRHVNVKFKIGNRMAVVGQNGSGKTTFIKLLCRLYDPTEGEILLNGIDIRKYSYEEYLSIFSVVFQDFSLFAFPLGENVAVARDYDGAKVEKTLRQAGFGERLDAMPKGLDTWLYNKFDEGGVEISGGEAQKIAIARALYKNAPFIILDEPTAALDPVAEAEIYARFNDIAGDKTAIYISHRLSSCRFCDEIMVFDGGTVVQKGSHETLVEAEGKYAALWNAQAQYYV